MTDDPGIKTLDDWNAFQAEASRTDRPKGDSVISFKVPVFDMSSVLEMLEQEEKNEPQETTHG